MILLAKLITLLTTSWITMYTYFCIITLVTSSIANLASNFSESNYIYPYYKWYKLCSDSTNSLAVLRIIIQTLDKNLCYTIIQPLAKFNCLYVALMMYQRNDVTKLSKFDILTYWVQYAAHYSILDNIVTRLKCHKAFKNLPFLMNMCTYFDLLPSYRLPWLQPPSKTTFIFIFLWYVISAYKNFMNKNNKLGFKSFRGLAP